MTGVGRCCFESEPCTGFPRTIDETILLYSMTGRESNAFISAPHCLTMCCVAELSLKQLDQKPHDQHVEHPDRESEGQLKPDHSILIAHVQKRCRHNIEVRSHRRHQGPR